MLLKLLIKLIILCLGLYLLNSMFYFGLNEQSKSTSINELTYPYEVFTEFLLNILYFKQINSWFAFSYILSALGFVTFVIYDYVKKDSLLLDGIKNDLSNVFGTLLFILLLNLIIFIVILIPTFLYLVLIYLPYEIGWGKILNNSEIAEAYEKTFQIDYSFNFLVYIVAILGNLFLLYLLSFYNELPNFTVKQNKKVDKFSKLFFSILPIYFVFTFPTILVWLYPTLVVLIENKSLPNTYILYLVLYSVGLIFIFYKTYKRIKKNRLSKLKAEIKEELIQELKEHS